MVQKLFPRRKKCWRENLAFVFNHIRQQLQSCKISHDSVCYTFMNALPPVVVCSFSETLCAWSMSWCLQRTKPELSGPNTLLQAPYSWDSSSASSLAVSTKSSCQAVQSGFMSSCQIWKVPPSFSRPSTGSIRLIKSQFYHICTSPLLLSQPFQCTIILVLKPWENLLKVFSLPFWITTKLGSDTCPVLVTV